MCRMGKSPGSERCIHGCLGLRIGRKWGVIVNEYRFFWGAGDENCSKIDLVMEA